MPDISSNFKQKTSNKFIKQKNNNSNYLQELKDSNIIKDKTIQKINNNSFDYLNLTINTENTLKKEINQSSLIKPLSLK